MAQPRGAAMAADGAQTAGRLPQPAGVWVRVAAAMASVVPLDLAVTALFILESGAAPWDVLRVQLPANLVILGAVNGLGAWVLTRPVRRLIGGDARAAHAATRRLRLLPRLAGAWIFTATLVYCAAVFAGGAFISDPDALARQPTALVLSATVAFAAFYALYYSFAAHFAVADLAQWLRARLGDAGLLTFDAGRRRLGATLLISLAVVTVIPLGLILLDASAFREVRAAQGLTPAESVRLNAWATLLVMLVAAAFLTRSLIAPLRLLEQRMDAVRGDGLNARAPVVRDDEIGQLITRFNHMADELHARAQRTEDALARVATLQRETEAAFEQTVDLLARAAELHDDVTGNHIARVSAYARTLAERMGLDAATVTDIAQAAKLHDVGKMSVDSGVLKKPGKLTEAEWREIKKHTEYGAHILHGVDRLATAAQVARWHHEKWDGSGYPDGLAGTDIPLAARIVALCDVYDALRGERPYKHGFDHATAVRIITEGDDRLTPEAHFDPRVLALFQAHHDDFRAIWDRHAAA